MYLQSVILEIRDFEILVENPELHEKANEMFDIENKLNLHLKRIIQISYTLTEFKDIIRANLDSKSSFKNFLNRAYQKTFIINVLKII